jgi:site-specific DNA-methyltransferase (adenine-specific)
MPVEVVRRILTVTPADLIVDPFLGSGTTLVAAKELGRRALGV